MNQWIWDLFKFLLVYLSIIRLNFVCYHVMSNMCYFCFPPSLVSCSIISYINQITNLSLHSFFVIFVHPPPSVPFPFPSPHPLSLRYQNTHG